MNKKIAAVLLLGLYGQQVDASQSKLTVDTLGANDNGQPSSVVSQGQGTWTDVVSPDAQNLSSDSRSRSSSGVTIEDINELSSQSSRSSRANSNASSANYLGKFVSLDQEIIIDHMESSGECILTRITSTDVIYDGSTSRIERPRAHSCDGILDSRRDINLSALHSPTSQSSNFAASAQKIVVTSTPGQKEDTYSVTPQSDLLKPTSIPVVSNEKMKSGKNEANTFWADTGLLVGWPVVGAIASAAFPSLIFSMLTTAVLHDTCCTTPKIYTNTGSLMSNIGHSLFACRIFVPILAYAGMMYGAPEKTSETFKQVAGPVLVGLTLAVAAENMDQAIKIHQKAVCDSGSCCGKSYSNDQSRDLGNDWKAANPTWENDQTFAKYKQLGGGSVAGFIYGSKLQKGSKTK